MAYGGDYTDPLYGQDPLERQAMESAVRRRIPEQGGITGKMDAKAVPGVPPGFANAVSSTFSKMAPPQEVPAGFAEDVGKIVGQMGPTGSTIERGKYRSSLHGFDYGKLDNQEKYGSHPKYAFANIAQDYEATPAGLEAMSKDPRFAQAGFKFLGKDKIQTPDGEVVDVGEAFGAGGKGWAWMPEGGPEAAGGAGGGVDYSNAMDPGIYRNLLGNLSQPGFFQQLLSRLQGEAGTGGETMDRAALSALMGGG